MLPSSPGSLSLLGGASQAREGKSTALVTELVMPRARLNLPHKTSPFLYLEMPRWVVGMGETLLEKSGLRCQAHSLGRGVGVVGRCRTCFPAEGFWIWHLYPRLELGSTAWNWGVRVGGSKQATQPGAASVPPVGKF